jgi:glucose/arabinose dehydrogenase
MRRRRSRAASFAPAAVVATALGLFLGIAPAEATLTLPANFSDQLVTNGVPQPTALAWTPDGRMLITDRSGKIRVYKNGALLATPALDISANVCSNGERGMLGVAVDPAFTLNSNNYVYVYYTLKKEPTCKTTDGSAPVPSDIPVNRVSRFTLGSDDLINPASELVLVDQIPNAASNHNAGDVQFGSDGYLYISVGDGGCDYAGGGCAGTNDAARDQFILLGKILRITKTGGIPPSNPFQGAGTARCNVTGSTASTNKCQETYAWGLRNPFRFAFDSNFPTRFYINDVGQATWEEVDLGQSGVDYGWNVREGPCPTGTFMPCAPPPVGMTDPIYWYQHSPSLTAITGGAFVPFNIWPEQYDDAYLYQDLGAGKVFMLTPNPGSGFTASDFGTGAPANTLVGMTFGPDGTGRALYYYTTDAQVRKIAFTGTRGYTSPVGASPIRVSLVPAFNSCTGANSTHGAPLNFPSCNPAARTSSTARLGTKSIGFAELQVCPVGSAVAQCSAPGVVEPDMRLFANLRDVRCVGTLPAGCAPGADYNPNASAGPYTTACTTAATCSDGTTLAQPYCAAGAGSSSACVAGTDVTFTARLPGAQASKGIRITDTFNGGTADVSATASDGSFAIPMDCRPTPSDSTIGSTCAVNTSANALVPGVVRTGDKSIWQVGEIGVTDSGPDGTRGNSDDETLAVQGIYIP